MPKTNLTLFSPNAVGIPNYLASLRRIDAKYTDLTKKSMRINQDAAKELSDLLSNGARQLQDLFVKLLQEGPERVEPLQYITKAKPFPVFDDGKLAQLAELHSFIANSPAERDHHQHASTVQAYGDIRGRYLQSSLSNLASASLTTSRRQNADQIYQRGTSAIGTYAQGIDLIFTAEWTNITIIFASPDWGKAFELATARATSEFARTLRELNAQVKAHMTTDCFLAYEVVGIAHELAFELDKRTGFLKQPLLDAVKPLRDSAKVSLAELLDDIRRRVTGMMFLPTDGASLPYTAEVMTRLQALPAYATPLGNIMASLGAGNWSQPGGGSSTGSASSLPTLKSFDVNPDATALLGRYVVDTLDALMTQLDARARAVLKQKPLIGLFLANNVAVADRAIRSSELQTLLAQQPAAMASKLEGWRKRGTAAYLDGWREPCAALMDVQYTNRATSGGGPRPPSGSAGSGQDSAAIVKALSGKDKDAIKDKFKTFNVLFESLSQRHRELAPGMEREVRAQLARDIQQLIDPLYGRFWERYHEIDKGKGKFVRYSKAQLAAQLATLA